MKAMKDTIVIVMTPQELIEVERYAKNEGYNWAVSKTMWAGGLVVYFKQTGTCSWDRLLTFNDVEYSKTYESWNKLKFSEFASKYLKKQTFEFPFSITCKDNHELAAAAQLLISYGCLVEGREDHLDNNFSYLKSFRILNVYSPTYFRSSSVVYGKDYKLGDDISGYFKSTRKFEPNDWLVCEESTDSIFTRGKLYKVTDTDGYVVTDDEDLVKYTEDFRKATGDEIFKHLLAENPWVKKGVKIMIGKSPYKTSIVKEVGLYSMIRSAYTSLLNDKYFKRHGDHLVIRSWNGIFPLGDVIDGNIPSVSEAPNELPIINGYEGRFYGDIVKYGSDKIDLYLLKNMVGEYKGNRKIRSITLDSGVTINVEDARRIIESIC